MSPLLELLLLPLLSPLFRPLTITPLLIMTMLPIPLRLMLTVLPRAAHCKVPTCTEFLEVKEFP